MTTRTLGLAAFILVLGAGFRFLIMGDIRFTGDEAYFWSTARDIVELKHFPSYGSPITGSDAHVPSPLFHYFMALPQIFGRSPRLGAGFVIILHLMSAWLVFDLARRVRGERAALFALVLLIFSPWDVFYGSSIWLGSVVPIHGTLLIYAACRVKDGPRWQTAFTLLLGVSLALHSSTPVAAAGALAMVVLAPPERLSWRHCLLGLGLAFLVFTPSIVKELQTEFANTHAILNKAGGAEPASYLAWMPAKVFGYAVLFSSSEISYHFTRGYWGSSFSEHQQYFTAAGLAALKERLGFWVIPTALSVFLSLGGFARMSMGAFAAVRRALKKAGRQALSSEHKLSLSLICALVVATLLLVSMKKLFFPHYANTIMQLLVLPPAFLLDALAERSSRVSRAAIAWVSVVALSMVVSTWTYVKTVDQLNGLDSVLAIAGRIAEENEPVALYFDHFHNGYSVDMVLRHYYGKVVPFGAGSRVIYRVHNRAAHVGPVPDGSWLIGNLRVDRTERARPRP